MLVLSHGMPGDRKRRLMRITIERLRTWIVLLGILLVVAIAAFLGYARFRIHQVARDLPQKLGLEIQQSTDNFTISKSHEGHTLFTLHASKAIQYKKQWPPDSA